MASLDKLRELNPYVRIECLNDVDLSKETDEKLAKLVRSFTCVVLTELDDESTLTRVNSACRANNVHFVLSNVYGLFGVSFTDFGENFETHDMDGEEYRDMFVACISNESEACVEVLDQHAHNLECDDFVRLTEVESPRELNTRVHRVTSVINAYKFRIDADTSNMTAYSRGGIFRKIKKKQTIRFKSLSEQLEKPDVILADLSETKFAAPYLVHILVRTHLRASHASLNDFLLAVRQASDEFKKANPSAPLPDDAGDLERLARVFYLTKRARLPPLAAFYGGLCAQETLKAITSKFIPFKQWFYLEYSELFERKNDDLDKLDTESKRLINSHDYANLC